MDETITPEQIQEIKRLLFIRVQDAATRSKIYRVAAANGEPNETEYWATIYHYSLSENWPDLNKEFKNINDEYGESSLADMKELDKKIKPNKKGKS